jgi:hypothetical protein
MYQKLIEYPIWPQSSHKIAIKILTSSIARPSKIYPNCDFCLKIHHLATLVGILISFPGANPTIASYNAMGSLGHFKDYFFTLVWKNF